INVVNPATEEIFLTVAEAQAADINRAVAAARHAFDHGPWPRMTHAQRAGYLREIAKKIAARVDNLADIWSSEVGVVRKASAMMPPRVAETYAYYASLADTFPFEERHTPKAGGNVGLLVREPVGVVAAIIPWNGPMALIAWTAWPAFLAGCTVIIKASPEAPGEANVMLEIMHVLVFHKGVFNVVTADREVSELLVHHPDVDKIT